MLMRRKNSGLTLIEVLVTVLIMAVGFLGLAGLQLTALRNNSSAYERSQATMLAYDIIDRMRANRNSANNGDYNTALDTAPTTTSCVGTAVTCSAPQMAKYDLNQWKCSLGKWTAHASCVGLGLTNVTLPEGDGAISFNGSVLTVTIQWENNRAAENAADRLTSLSINTIL